MTADAASISEKAYSALRAPNDDGRRNEHPNMREVFAEWSNNTTKEENAVERAALNATVQKFLPTISIVGMGTIDGKNVVSIYDSKSHHTQLRSVEDFSVVIKDKDLTAQVVQNGKEIEPGEVVKSLVETSEKSTNNQGDKKGTDTTAPANEKDNPDKSKPTDDKPESKKPDSDKPEAKKPDSDKPETDKPDSEKGTYQIKHGDTLWKIASRYLTEHNGGKTPSHKDVRHCITEIMALNKSGHASIKDENRIFAGHKINLPPAESKPGESKPEDSDKKQTESNPKSGDTPQNESNQQDDKQPAPEQKSDDKTKDIIGQDQKDQQDPLRLLGNPLN